MSHLVSERVGRICELQSSTQLNRLIVYSTGFDRVSGPSSQMFADSVTQLSTEDHRRKSPYRA